jgi:hypothetical protein
MPRFYFDLVGPESVLDQHGMLLGDLQFAAHAAERLAAELFTVRPELRGTASVVLLDAHRSNRSIASPSRRIQRRKTATFPKQSHPALGNQRPPLRMTPTATAARSPPPVRRSSLMTNEVSPLRHSRLEG